MRVLFYLGHPAHYHFFKNSIKKLLGRRHKILIIIKTKDILEDLLKNDDLNYINILPKGRRDNKISILFGLLKRDVKIGKILLNSKIDFMIGSEPSLSHNSKLFNIPSVITVEDDTHVIPYFAHLTYPFANEILAPHSCDLGRWNHKKISYQGFQKLAYLHPKYFKPQKKIAENMNRGKKKYFLLRISKLSAHHDFGVKGISNKVLEKILNMLKKHGNVFISSERKLRPEFERYRININVSDIHHIIYYAEMLIGDSQSMSVEAAMLGTPSLRFSDFSGKIGILEELEHKYGLTYGIKSSQPEKLYNKTYSLLNFPNLKKEFRRRCNKMIQDKIDVTAFMVWFIENYPDSSDLVKRDPNYQYRFR
jgi:predicted glycosyltransferase